MDLLWLAVLLLVVAALLVAAIVAAAAAARKNVCVRGGGEITLKDAYERMRSAARAFREANPSGNGREFWQPYKKRLLNLELSQPLSWRPTKEFRSVESFEPLDRDRSRETNHFLYQLATLARRESFSATRFVQLGLNAGQWEAGQTQEDVANRDHSRGVAKLSIGEVEQLLRPETHLSEENLRILVPNIF